MTGFEPAMTLGTEDALTESIEIVIFFNNLSLILSVFDVGVRRSCENSFKLNCALTD